MNSLGGFIAQFAKRGGVYVLFSSFGTKVISLIVSVFIARELTTQDYAVVSYALMVITFLIPLSGLGMDFTLLRYGSLTNSKRRLLQFTLKFGGLGCLCLVVIIVGLSDFIAIEDERSSTIIKIMSALLVIEFFYRVLQNYQRINEKNQLFALAGIFRSITLLLSSYILVGGYSLNGYILALIISPLVPILLFYKTMIDAKNIEVLQVEYNRNEMMKYGLLIGFGSMVSQLQIPLAGILLGKISNDIDQLALYKVASVIPLSLLFLPNVFFKSEFVHLTKNSNDRKVIRSYILSYWKISSLMCLPLIIIAIYFSEPTMVFVFGEKYRNAGTVFSILIIAVIGGLLLRQLFGNLTFAAGRADINTIISILALIFSLVTLPYLISEYGAIGAAWGTVSIFWFTGLINMISYYIYVYKSIKIN